MIQVWFAGGAHRDYAVRYYSTVGRSREPALWEPAKLAPRFEAGSKAGDLRDHDQAADLERLILKHAKSAQ